jgi:glucosylglycerate synthase
MPDTNPLPLELAGSLRGGAAEIVVGLPSCNHAATIVGVAESIRRGLREAFPDKPAILVNTDCASSDGTAQQMAALPEVEGVRLVQINLPAQDLDMPYHGIPGKGDGLRMTLHVARLVGARVCILLSPDLVGMPADWIRQLGTPVLEQGFDFVLPVYVRHRLARALTSGIVRPLVATLYGRYVEQPMGREYACSAALVERYLGQNVWGSDLVRFGSDIWAATQAICGPFKVCQTRLGEKHQALPASAPDLGSTVSQVLGAFFEDMSRNASVWQRVRGAQPTPVLGPASEAAPTDSPPSFDSKKLLESFRLGLRNLQDLWGLVLAPATLLELKRVAAAAAESFLLPDELWARAVFDFALGYRMRTLNRSHLLGSFLPLYLGWLASFARELQALTDPQSERRMERLCLAYEAQKPYLISRWRSPDRFNP